MPAQAKIDKASRRKKIKREKKRELTPGIILGRFLLITILALMLGAVYKLFSSWQGRLWIPNTRFTVVVAKDNPTIYSYNPRSGELLVIPVPENTEVEASGGYGSFLAGNLWELGARKKAGGGILSASLMKSLGFPIDAWVGPDGEDLFQNKSLFWPALALKAAFLGQLETNLTFFDRFQILLAVGGTPGVGRRAIDLEGIGIIKKTFLADGVEGFTVLPERAKVVFEAFRDETVLEEGHTLIVVNTSGKRGLAGGVVQVVTALGVRVVGTAQRDEKVDGCVVKKRPNIKESVSTKRIAGIFGCNQEVGDFSGASDIELLLGDPFAGRF